MRHRLICLQPSKDGPIVVPIAFFDDDHSGYERWLQGTQQQGLGWVKEDLAVIMDLLGSGEYQAAINRMGRATLGHTDRPPLEWLRQRVALYQPEHC